MSSTINLRIVTRNGDMTFHNVIEYVAGKLNFYVHYRKDGSNDTTAIKRSTIKSVHRFNHNNSWPINLKVFKD